MKGTRIFHDKEEIKKDVVPGIIVVIFLGVGPQSSSLSTLAKA